MDSQLIDLFFTAEELKREKQLPPLSKKDEEVLSKISNAIIDRVEEAIEKNKNKA